MTKLKKKHLPPMEVDLRRLRPGNLTQPEYRHLLFLLFWPVYGLRYLLVEAVNPVERCTPVHCFLDDLIPFHEIFIVPYLLWFVFFIGMHIYTALYDVKTFRKYTRFLLIAFSISTTIFLLYPTCQFLRPAEFPRDNIFTDIVSLIYATDTCTNVCPSEHVIGSVAVVIAAFALRPKPSRGHLAFITLFMLLISLSTLFLKQHSVVDLVAALPICLLAWWFSFRTPKTKNEPACPAAE